MTAEHGAIFLAPIYGSKTVPHKRSNAGAAGMRRPCFRPIPRRVRHDKRMLRPSVTQWKRSRKLCAPILRPRFAMPRSFFRSLRALDGEHRATTLAIAATGGVLLVAWSAWFCFAKVSLFVTSERARVEAVGAVHFVDAPETAQLIRVHATLGQRVRAGDVLFELDVAPQQLTRDEDAARVTSATHEAETLRRQIAAAEQALRETERAASAIQRAAEADRTEAASAAKLAEEERLRNE